MWSDNDIDKAFQRLNPSEPEPTPFPLDAWLRLETQLDQAVIARAVRHKLWQFFAAEVAVVALLALGWWLWPTRPAKSPATDGVAAQSAAVPRAAGAVTRPGTTGAAATTPIPPSGAALGRSAISAPALPKPMASAVPAELDASSGAVLPTTTRPGRPAKSFASAPVAVAVGATPRSRPRNAAGEAAPLFSNASWGAFANPAGATRGPVRGRLALAVSGRASVIRRQTENGAAGAAPSGAYRASSDQSARSPHAATTLAEADNASLGTASSASERADGPSPAPPNAPDGLAAQVVALAQPVAPARPAPLAGVAAAPAPGAEPARLPRFYLGLVAAPDVSTVKFAGVQSPLPNVGLTLEYRLTARLRLTTGLLRSNKQYAARREDYDWGPYQARAYQRDFRTVDATCTVLDVPLNLRYDLTSEARHRVFASAGLSSFFMQRERYSYDYLENNMPRQWSLEVVNANRHLGSILNLSAGYERRLGARWTAQAEPYFKLPLAGVGAGQVRLTSAGVFFGLKYGL